jgi:hypothetical protein
VGVAAAEAEQSSADRKDIRKLTQHFIDPRGDTSPWVFYLQDNIRSISTSERPGFATIKVGSKGKDIKGILKDPISVDEYPIPWEFHLGFGQSQSSENSRVGSGMPHEDPGCWHAGVQYFPEERRYRFINIDAGPLEIKRNPNINIEFEPELPESILAHRPVYTLVQILDSSRLRVGFRTEKTAPWYFSKVFDTVQTFGKIGKFNLHTCFTGSVSNRNLRGWGIGNFPRYPRFLVDYVRYGKGLSTPSPQTG